MIETEAREELKSIGDIYLQLANTICGCVDGLNGQEKSRLLFATTSHLLARVCKDNLKPNKDDLDKVLQMTTQIVKDYVHEHWDKEANDEAAKA